MAHDVFISHSSKDKAIADATCAQLENRGIRCWVAPRDIAYGADWPASIARAIRACRVMVVIFSEHANTSKHIKREVEIAVNSDATVIPMRIEQVRPVDAMDYFLSAAHWLEAYSPPLDAHLERLARAIHEILKLNPPTREPVVTTPHADPIVPALEKHAEPPAAPEPILPALPKSPLSSPASVPPAPARPTASKPSPGRPSGLRKIGRLILVGVAFVVLMLIALGIIGALTEPVSPSGTANGAQPVPAAPAPVPTTP